MAYPEGGTVRSIDALRALYAEPVERIAKKALNHVSDVGRAFIAASPFWFWQPQAKKASTAHRRAIGLAMWKLRQMVGRSSA